MRTNIVHIWTISKSLARLMVWLIKPISTDTVFQLQKSKNPNANAGVFQFQMMARGGIEPPITKQPEGYFVAPEMMAKATDY